MEENNNGIVTSEDYNYESNQNQYRLNSQEIIQDNVNSRFEYNQGNYNSFNVEPEPEPTSSDYSTIDKDLMRESEIKNTKKKKEKKEKKAGNGTGKKVVGFVFKAAAFGLIAGSVMFGVNALGNKVYKKDVAQSPVTTEVATVAPIVTETKGNDNVNVADVVENVMPSIVSVTNTSVQTVRSWFQSYEQEVQGAGSGIVIGQTEDEVLVATNNHVVNNAKEITITFCDDACVAATIKGVDSASDLAVVAVKTKDMEQSTLDAIKVAALGSSDELRVGDPAIAIGNALGYGQSVTVGYISALGRTVEAEEASSIKMLQTDAAINPGNSGGALLNENGEVIGINSAKYVDSTVEGMGYAIPISDAIPIINDLMNRKVVKEDEQGYLGIQGNDITDEYAQGFKMPKGVYVVKILDDSPAQDCGLKAGDVITSFAGKEITSMEELQGILSSKKAGDEVEMVIQRNNEKGEYEEVKIKVKLGAKKDMPAGEKENSSDNSSNSSRQPNNQPGYQNGDPYFNGDIDDFFNEFDYFFGH